MVMAVLNHHIDQSDASVVNAYEENGLYGFARRTYPRASPMHRAQKVG